MSKYLGPVFAVLFLLGLIAWTVYATADCRRSGGHPVRGVFKPVECIR